jgi:hypothetical protein
MDPAQFLSPLVVLVPSNWFCASWLHCRCARYIRYSAEGCRILTTACSRTLPQPHATRSSIPCFEPFDTSPLLLVSVCALWVL